MNDRGGFVLVGDPRSGNCVKVAMAATHLGLDYDWEHVDVMSGVTRSREFLARNPAGQVPLVEYPDGRRLAQSNAILRYLAESSALIPDDPWQRAQMDQWLFWEQYSHEPTIAVLRFQRVFLGWSGDRLDPERIAKGARALEQMETVLTRQDWLVEAGFSLADLALVAYTRWAGEAGYDLAGHPAIGAWIGRVDDAVPMAQVKNPDSH